MVKVDKLYLSTPTKIAILDHERKRTFVLRKDGLPDAGELAMTMLFIGLLVCYSYINAYKYHCSEEIEHFIIRMRGTLQCVLVSYILLMLACG